MVADGATSTSSLVDYGIDAEIPGGSLAGLALDMFGIETDYEVPIDLDLELTSDAGRVQVVSGGGTIAGVPTGPLGRADHVGRRGPARQTRRGP